MRSMTPNGYAVSASMIRISGTAIASSPSRRSGMPSGTRSQITLRIVFDQYLLNSGEAQDTDRPGGLDLVSWDEWIAELGNQKLALRVGDRVEGSLDNDFEFVPA